MAAPATLCLIGLCRVSKIPKTSKNLRKECRKLSTKSGCISALVYYSLRCWMGLAWICNLVSTDQTQNGASKQYSDILWLAHELFPLTEYQRPGTRIQKHNMAPSLSAWCFCVLIALWTTSISQPPQIQEKILWISVILNGRMSMPTQISPEWSARALLWI